MPPQENGPSSSFCRQWIRGEESVRPTLLSWSQLGQETNFAQQGQQGSNDTDQSNYLLGSENVWCAWRGGPIRLRLCWKKDINGSFFQLLVQCTACLQHGRLNPSVLSRCSEAFSAAPWSSPCSWTMTLGPRANLGMKCSCDSKSTSRILKHFHCKMMISYCRFSWSPSLLRAYIPSFLMIYKASKMPS